MQPIRRSIAEADKFLRAIYLRNLIRKIPAGTSKRIKQIIKSVHNGYRDLTIRIKGIQYQSFQLRYLCSRRSGSWITPEKRDPDIFYEYFYKLWIYLLPQTIIQNVLLLMFVFFKHYLALPFNFTRKVSMFWLKFCWIPAYFCGFAPTKLKCYESNLSTGLFESIQIQRVRVSVEF